MESVVDYILDGLEAALELERELGVRAVELERPLDEVFAVATGVTAVGRPLRDRRDDADKSAAVATGVTAVGRPLRDRRDDADKSAAVATGVTAVGRPLRDRRDDADKSAAVATGVTAVGRPLRDRRDESPKKMVFLHHQALSPAGVEMMAKIVKALALTEAEAPVVIEKPIPKAQVYVVLGLAALRKFAPGVKAEPGQWTKSVGGKDLLVTVSPEYILRFSTVTPAVEQIKLGLWRSLKSARQRIR